jgi:hypothetical protein
MMIFTFGEELGQYRCSRVMLAWVLLVTGVQECELGSLVLWQARAAA